MKANWDEKYLTQVGCSSLDTGVFRTMSNHGNIILNHGQRFKMKCFANR